MAEIRIRAMDQDEEFASWLTELLETNALESDSGSGFEDHYLGLTDEKGDWVGGARYFVRGGVAHLLDLAVIPEARHQGHAHRLLAAFEIRATSEGAQLAEFWTDDARSEALLGALGWETVLHRPRYMAGRPWTLLEKRLAE